MAGSEQAHFACETNPERPWVGIVDDDASLRAALARALRVNGIRVETFGSANEFLERDCAATPPPDCVVLDIHLGGLSGLDLRDRLESEGIAPPIIFITAHDDMLAELAAARSCGYLRKPFETQALLALVRPHLRSTEMNETR